MGVLIKRLILIILKSLSKFNISPLPAFAKGILLETFCELVRNMENNAIGTFLGYK